MANAKVTASCFQRAHSTMKTARAEFDGGDKHHSISGERWPISTAMRKKSGKGTHPRRHVSLSRSKAILILSAIVQILGSSSETLVKASRIPLPGKKTPEASSTLLKMHRLYTLHPPHDGMFYDLLGVSPNATAAEITKAYRKKSRCFHPDKRRRRDSNNGENDDDEKLNNVRQAYEILKDDSTRLIYHRYGLVDTSVAALILTGGASAHSLSKEQRQLLHLMGFGPKLLNPQTKRHEQRILFLAANLVEKIRPLVEGAISDATLAEAVARECDALKRLPLGAQIMRCIGRAYRHVGHRALRNQTRKKHRTVADNIHDKYRHAKHIATAAVASGRLVLTEHSSRRNQPPENKSKDQKAIGYHHLDDSSLLDELLGEDDYDLVDDHVKTNREISEIEKSKAQKALIEALQVEALWKISKVDLDKTIQEACNLVLSGEYFFFPSHASRQRSEWRRPGGDGWVGSTGQTIDARYARIRTAQALVLMGNVMVECSKDGTAWME